MKKYNLLAMCFLLLTGTLFISCDKDDDDDTVDVAPQFTIEMDHLLGLEKFHLDSTYMNALNQEFTPTLFKYYVSNISLIRDDNTEYVLPQSYFLVNQDNPESMLLNLTNLQSGSYKAIKFLVGVDSARNVSGAQTCALAPDSAMFWDWDTGYIFLKLEGTSPVITGASQNFEYHIGGFEGPESNLRYVSFDFDGDMLHLAINRHPELHVVVDVQQIFYDPTIIDFTSFPTVIVEPGPAATTIADNYSADMFNFDHLHDD